MTGRFHLDPEQPPLIKLVNAAPLLPLGLPLPQGQAFQQGRQFQVGAEFLAGQPQRVLGWARLPNRCLGLALVALVGWWSWRLWASPAATLTAVALASLEPSLVAHSSLATLDLPAAALAFLLLYCLWERRWNAAGLALGAMLATKFTGVMLACVVLVCVLRPLRGHWHQLGRILALATLVVVLSYGVGQVGRWGDGLRIQLGHAASGGPAFYCGQVLEHGAPSYFLACFVLKSTLGLLLLLLLALPGWRRERAAWFVVAPLVGLLALSSTFKLALGVRYVLLLYPLACLAAARVAREASWVAGLAVLLSAATSLPAAPHELAWFNGLAGGRPYELLGDSNLDWGQDLGNLGRELQGQECYLGVYGGGSPGDYGIAWRFLPRPFMLQKPGPPPPPGVPDDGPGLLVLGASCLQLTQVQGEFAYDWLWLRPPTRTVGGSMLVYDVRGDAEALKQLALTYRRCGDPALARVALLRAARLAPGDRTIQGLLRLHGDAEDHPHAVQ